MAGVKLTIEIDQQAINRLTSDMDGDMAKDLLRRGVRVERKAKGFVSGDRVKVRTGRLRSSIHAELFRMPNGMVGCRIGTDVFYGRYLNSGTRYIRPRWWLTDAMDAAR